MMVYLIRVVLCIQLQGSAKIMQAENAREKVKVRELECRIENLSLK